MRQAYLHHSAVHQGADGASTQPGPQPLEEAHLPIDPDDVLGCTRGNHTLSRGNARARTCARAPKAEVRIWTGPWTVSSDSP